MHIFVHYSAAQDGVKKRREQERGQPCPREFEREAKTRGQGCPRSFLESAHRAAVAAKVTRRISGTNKRLGPPPYVGGYKI